MKKYVTSLMVALSLIIGFGTQTTAASSSNELTVQLTGDDIDIQDQDPWGMRMPSAPVTCTIDFATLSISSNRIPNVHTYELWDEAGEKNIVSYTTDYDMVIFMSSLTGCFQLKLVTDETTYIGYIEL